MNANYIPPARFVPAMRPAMASRVMPSSGFYAPSGALTSQQILDLQGALVATGNAPASAITGRMPIGTAAQLLSFQRNYNAENACRRNPNGAGCHPPYSNSGFSPSRISEDGQWGPNTQAALQNYVAFARSAAANRIPQVPVDIPAEADGWHSAPGPGAQATLTPIGKPGVTTMVKGNGTPAVQPSPAARPSTSAPAPLAIPPSNTAPASTFPTGPAIALGVGAVAIVGALVYRSRKKRSGGKG